MMCESTKRLEFKARISPHLERLMQFSICLTQNGRDATRLLHDAITEAYRGWNDSMSEPGCSSRLHTIITRRYFIGFKQPTLPVLSSARSNYRISGDGPVRPSFTTTTVNLYNTWVTGESEVDNSYLKAIAGLPPVFRSAMILSYLEGFSLSEIADLAGIPPHVIGSLLNRGRRLIHEELFEHLIGEEGLEQEKDRVSESA
jgi:RNA polymerase sigma-70 factor (ECF subfamily)